MPLSIVRNNITAMQVDAIVNTANPRPLIGDGVDTAIHMAAGPELLEARRKIGDIARGKSAITPAFHLPAKYVIHTVGPIWQDGEHGEEATLRSCYDSALALAAEYECESAAFPLISAGTYGFPKALALQTAISAISAFLMSHENLTVYLVVFDRTAYALSEKLFSDVKSYIDENLVDEIRAAEYVTGGSRRQNKLLQGLRAEREWEDNRVCESACFDLEDIPDFSYAENEERSLEDLLGQLEESFSEALVRMIKERGLKNSQVYTRANMTRQHFSKILKNEGYQPKKEAVLALAIALKLNLDETRDFLARAGYALTRSSKTDVIVQYFIETENYNIFELEQVLFQFTEKTLINY
ncbi:MAG: macro domain-containing protein [Firmicutes bacterium]|nr:macro domain-containing protein [Bacillota bacterium]